MEFEVWWNSNKELYTLLGIKKEYAKSIWNDAQLALKANEYLADTSIS
jgi:hypothetical protein